MANKAPAFQFYASDFLASTIDMTNAEVGAYVRALCHSWDRGPLPKEHHKLARLMQAPDKEFKQVWPAIQERLTEGSDGYTNDRLEIEREKQAAYREKQSAKGRHSAQQRFNRGSTVVTTTVQPEHQPEHDARLQPEANSPSPSPISISKPESAKSADSSRAPADGGEWRQRSTRRGLMHSPIQHSGCYPSHGCGRGLCVPRFVADEWLGQCSGDSAYVGMFIANTLKFIPAGPQGDPAKFWRAQWDAKHRTPIATTKAARTMAAGDRVAAMLEQGVEIDPFGLKADARAKALAEKAGA